MHAARMARYRAKLAKSSADVAAGMPDEGWPREIEIVTHHGSPPPPADDLVAVGATTMPRDDASPAEPPGPAVTQCHRCGRAACCRFAAGSCAVAITVAAVLARSGGSATAMLIATEEDMACTVRGPAQMLPDLIGAGEGGCQR